MACVAPRALVDDAFAWGPEGVDVGVVFDVPLMCIPCVLRLLAGTPPDGVPDIECEDDESSGEK